MMKKIFSISFTLQLALLSLAQASDESMTSFCKKLDAKSAVKILATSRAEFLCGQSRGPLDSAQDCSQGDSNFAVASGLIAEFSQKLLRDDPSLGFNNTDDLKTFLEIGLRAKINQTEIYRNRQMDLLKQPAGEKKSKQVWEQQNTQLAKIEAALKRQRELQEDVAALRVPTDDSQAQNKEFVEKAFGLYQRILSVPGPLVYSEAPGQDQLYPSEFIQPESLRNQWRSEFIAKSNAILVPGPIVGDDGKTLPLPSRAMGLLSLRPAHQVKVVTDEAKTKFTKICDQVFQAKKLGGKSQINTRERGSREKGAK